MFSQRSFYFKCVSSGELSRSVGSDAMPLVLGRFRESSELRKSQRAFFGGDSFFFPAKINRLLLWRSMGVEFIKIWKFSSVIRRFDDALDHTYFQ